MIRILLICLALACFGSCHKKRSTDDQSSRCIRINLHTDPPSLDSRKATDTSSIGIISMCFEGLLKRGKNGVISSALAYKVDTSDDHLVYTFHLRDAKWSDGKELTAHDFENTWKTILNPSFPSGFAHDLYILKNGWAVNNRELPIDQLGVKALDKKTLQVELQHPIPYFLDLVASHSFFAVPTHITSKNPKWADDAGLQFVGNGPYRMIAWKHHNYISLEKNPNYWDEKSISLDRIELTIVEDSNTELNMFESGQLDWAGHPLSSLPTDALQALEKDPRFNSYPLSGTYYYIFNVNEVPFNNLKMRKAFTYAINRKSIIENITQSDQVPATSFIPPTIWEIKSYFTDADVHNARLLFHEGLEELGMTKESFPKITLTYNSSEAHHKIAQAIQEQWFRAFGIRVQLANVEWKVFLDNLFHKQFQIARMGGIAGFNDPMTFFDLYKHPGSSNNYSGWSNPQFTELVEMAEKTIDLNEREKLLRKAENLFMSEMPIAPIYYYQGNYLKNSDLKGVQLSEFSDIDFKFAFLETP